MNDSALTTLNLIDQLLTEATTKGRPREIDPQAFARPLTDRTQRDLPAVTPTEARRLVATPR
ncbi:MAG: hypothetical protein AAF805_05185 [Planctomycetota bacterium]